MARTCDLIVVEEKDGEKNCTDEAFLLLLLHQLNVEQMLTTLKIDSVVSHTEISLFAPLEKRVDRFECK